MTSHQRSFRVGLWLAMILLAATAIPQPASGQDDLLQPGQVEYGAITLVMESRIHGNPEVLQGRGLDELVGRLTIESAGGAYPPQVCKILVFDSQGEVYREHTSRPFEPREGMNAYSACRPDSDLLPEGEFLAGDVLLPAGLTLGPDAFLAPAELDAFIVAGEIPFLTPGFREILATHQEYVDERLATFQEMWASEAEWTAMIIMFVPEPESEAWESPEAGFRTGPATLLVVPRRW